MTDWNWNLQSLVAHHCQIYNLLSKLYGKYTEHDQSFLQVRNKMVNVDCNVQNNWIFKASATKHNVQIYNLLCQLNTEHEESTLRRIVSKFEMVNAGYNAQSNWTSKKQHS